MGINPTAPTLPSILTKTQTITVKNINLKMLFQHTHETVSFSSTIILDNLLNSKSIFELLPNLRSQTVAAHLLHFVLYFCSGFMCDQKVPAQFPYINCDLQQTNLEDVENYLYLLTVQLYFWQSSQ